MEVRVYGNNVVVNYSTVEELQGLVFDLWSCDEEFVVSPKQYAVGMSRQAAQMIGVIDDYS